MRFTKLFSRRRGPVLLEPEQPPSRESSPDFHQLRSARRRNGDVRRPSRREGAGTLQTRFVVDEEHPPCVMCRAIDFPTLLDWQPGNPRPWVELSHTLPHDADELTSAQKTLRPPLQNGGDEDSADTDAPEEPLCPYCAFFRLLVGATPDETGKFIPYLRIRLAFEKLGVKEKHEFGRTVMAEVTTKDKFLPWGYIIKAAPESAGDDGLDDMQTYISKTSKIEGRIVTPLLDPRLLKTWLDFCKDNHGDSCAHKIETPVPGMRLVDCQEMRVVSAAAITETEYAALSYLRSELADDSLYSSPNEGRLTDSLPRLIGDAISLATSLGYRYIWIDYLCAPLTREAKRQHEDMIGTIFNNAAVTFIAAADDDSGIPGISIPREAQPSLHTDAGVFTTSLLRPDLEVAGYRWSNSVKTFQEGLLSRRRLVFTPSQVYFQCEALHCRESIACSLHLASGLKFGRIFQPEGATMRPGLLKDVIGAYMPRVAPSDKERLESFRGVLQCYKQASSSVDSFLGLPLFSSTEFSATDLISRTDRLAVGLGWMPKSELPQQGPSKPYVFHGGFPSWTWLSWWTQPNASANQGFHFNMVGEVSPIVEKVTAAPMMKAAIGFSDDAVLQWEEDEEAISNKDEDTTFLRLTTWVFDIKIREDVDAGFIVDCNMPKAARMKTMDWFRSTETAQALIAAAASKPPPTLDPAAAPQQKEAAGGKDEAAAPTSTAKATPPADVAPATHEMITKSAAIIQPPTPTEKPAETGKSEKPSKASKAAKAAKALKPSKSSKTGKTGSGVSSPVPGTPRSGSIDATTPAEARSSDVSVKEDDQTVQHLTGIIVNGRGWAEGSTDGAVTVLICEAEPDKSKTGEDETIKSTTAAAIAPMSTQPKLRRLGALHVDCDGFAAVVAEKSAILRGVVTDVNEKKALKVELKEVDLY